MGSRTPTRDKCKICGHKLWSGEYICGRCDRRREYHDTKVIGYKMAGLTCTVVYCPGGEYARGAIFPGHDFNLSTMMHKKHSISTLTVGHWVEGMIIEDSNGNTWKVVGKEQKKQALERVNDMELPSDEARIRS